MLRRRRLVLALGLGLVAGLAVCLGVAMLVPGAGPRPPAAAAPRPSAPAPESSAVATLRAWDARRARAWADGDPEALRDLYAADSTAGAADVRLLRRWTVRGLRVRGITEQVLAARVVESGPRRIRLVVTERFSGGSAGPPGAAGVRLPRGSARTSEVRLRRTTGEWQVVSVRRPAPRPPPR